MRATLILPAFLLLLSGAASAPAETAMYQIRTDGDSEVIFVSRAVGETFEGHTSQLHGEFSVDPDDLSQPIFGRIIVPVASLDTGISLRNNHMFENHLHPDQYPEIIFELSGLIDPPASLPVGEAVELTAQGAFTLHGVTKEIRPTLIVQRDASGDLQVDADWRVMLADYDIPRPQFLFVKLAEEQEVSASFIARRSGGAE